jgi:type IV secretion system protein VirB10
MQTIVIPAGTRIPLALASPIAPKSARPRNAVRAVTEFPITVGTQLAIPIGTYVEGVIDKVTKGGRSGRTLQIHFTHLLYANGYSVAVDGANAEAKALSPESNSPERTAFASTNGSNYALAAQQSPGLPPLPRLGPSVGTVVGVVAGVFVAAIVSIALLSHHQGRSNGVLFETGWQFEMVLQSPVSVDAMSVTAAVATPTAE